MRMSFPSWAVAVNGVTFLGCSVFAVSMLVTLQSLTLEVSGGNRHAPLISDKPFYSLTQLGTAVRARCYPYAICPGTLAIHMGDPTASLFHGPDVHNNGIRNQRGSPVESLDVQRSAEPDTDSDPPSSLNRMICE